MHKFDPDKPIWCLAHPHVLTKFVPVDDLKAVKSAAADARRMALFRVDPHASRRTIVVARHAGDSNVRLWHADGTLVTRASREGRLHVRLERLIQSAEGSGLVLAAPGFSPREPPPEMLTLVRGTYEAMNRDLLGQILAEAGSIRKAAKVLRVPRSTLGAWTKRFGLV